MSRPPVDAGEALSRFLTQPKNHFAPTTGRLRYAAFLPNRALQTSVYRILGLTPDEVWSIGDVLVGAPLGKPISARADIGAKAVFGLGLAVDPDGIPHPSHAKHRGLVRITLGTEARCDQARRSGCLRAPVESLSRRKGLVGPRPERPELVRALARDIPFYRTRLILRPGLTGWAQVNHPYGDSVADAVEKLEYDLYYLKHRSMPFDLRILVRTVGTVLRFEGR